MSRLIQSSFAVMTALCTLGAISSAVGAEPARHNPVSVKIIWPTDPRPEFQVETWVATKLTNLGRAKFAAVTPWMAITGQDKDRARVWDGMMGDKRCGCPVVGEIVGRDNGRVKVQLVGWSPAGGRVTVTIRDEPGRRKIVPVEDATPGREAGLAYVAVLIGTPPKSIDPAHIKDKVSVTLNQQLALDFKRDGDQLQPNLLENPEANKQAVRIKLRETSDSPVRPPHDGAKRPYLSVENGFGKALPFRAAMSLKGSKEYFEIDDLQPVPAGETLNRCWGFDDRVEEVIVYQFKLSENPVK